MKNLKASVLIANYNNEKYINECLKSLLNQNYKNFEIIFHDDDSDDRSIEIINEIAKKNSKIKIKIISNKKRGKNSSFNQLEAYERAFRKSSGEIIFFLDSDDFFKKNKISKVISKFENNSKIIGIYDLPVFKFQNSFKKIKKKTKFFKTYWPYIPPQSCLSIRRNQFKKIIDKIKIKNFFDIWMDFRIAIYLIYLENKYYIFEENLTYYRQTEKSISSKFLYNSKNWWKRRSQAHDYIKYFFNINKIPYKKNIDFFITKFIDLFI